MRMRLSIYRNAPLRQSAGTMVWLLYAAALLAAPLVFTTAGSLSLLSQIGTTMIFALSFNMLLGQGGMLSFGHAVYSGLGAFVAVHALNLAADGALWMPVALAPLAGGLAGMLFGGMFGYLATKKSGTTFAMITLGIGELVFAASLMFPDFFGGEGGIAIDRVIGEPVLGITYGPQIEVYYLIAFWLFASTVAMYAFTRTPLGRIINAVRDNPERAEFIGYDARWARYLTFVLSAFFAGISGGLAAINFEIVTAENLSATRSAAVLLFTFIGGTSVFFGPMIGAVAGIFLTVMLSGYTQAWQLYLGVFFILLVMYAPGGLASILMQVLRLAKYGKLGAVWPALWRAAVPGLFACAGGAAALEMLYHRNLAISGGSLMTLWGYALDTAAPAPWAVAGAVTIAGACGFVRARVPLVRVWRDAHADVESRAQQEPA
jgi:branched-chain amino acid transport system permease protein